MCLPINLGGTTSSLTIVGFTRKEHHAKRQVRIVPLFPEIEREFFTLHLEAEEGAKEH
jgi:hypothetical protein